MLQRREAITLIGSAVVAWPLAARAQQSSSVRRIGALMNASSDDADGQARVIAFVQALQELGWTNGRNARIDIRWGAGDTERYRQYAEELVALAPDVILAPTSTVVAALQRATRTIPIVFTSVIDPVGAGFVANLARPGGNTTGFAAFEYGISGKWLALLKEIAPGIKRAAVLRDAAIAAGIGQFAAIQAGGWCGLPTPSALAAWAHRTSRGPWPLPCGSSPSCDAPTRAPLSAEVLGRTGHLDALVHAQLERTTCGSLLDPARPGHHPGQRTLKKFIPVRPHYARTHAYWSENFPRGRACECNQCRVSVPITVPATNLILKNWSEWQDLNLRPPRPERGVPPSDCSQRFRGSPLESWLLLPQTLPAAFFGQRF